MPVCDPYLLRQGRLDEGCRSYALALVRVLAGHDVAHQGAVGVVHHQRVARQCRAPKPAQRREPAAAPEKPNFDEVPFDDDIPF